ncbi:MAG: sigma-54 dependent transcriptional regulator [Thermodesulfovibrionales bacterium]|nr:sigma-54 dependent transcriptional regulator [Thermodesulfovibrionales bacterium]
MSRQNYRILVVDDEMPFMMLLVKILQSENYSVKGVTDPEEAIDLINTFSPNLVISDLKMPKIDGIKLLEITKKKDKDIDFILITAFATVETAVSAMKIGATDYLIKPLKDPEELRLVVNKVYEKYLLLSENIHLKSEFTKDLPPLNLIFAGMTEVFEEVKSVAPLESTIIIYGETGTGKTLIAKVIHHLSKRKGPFVEINCAAIPENLLESELFGHEKGAFTGAHTQKKGKFEIAQDGTIFLDEVSEIPLSLQPKLLKAVHEKTFDRLGSINTLRTNARIIAATNRDLKEMVQEKKFREDLFFRLNVFPIRLLPLRQRVEHIPEIANYILKKISAKIGKKILRIAPNSLNRLKQYPWPGNIRELENIIERSVILCKDIELEIPEQILENISSFTIQETLNPPSTLKLDGDIRTIEKKAIEEALKKTSGNRKKAAEILGISLRSLHYKIKDYGIKK